MNKNNPNRIVHIDINKTKIRFPKLSEMDWYVDKKTNHTTLK